MATNQPLLVPVWDPSDHVLRRVPAGDVPALRSLGMKTGDDAEAQDNREGFGGTIGTLLAAVPHGATAGVSDVALGDVAEKLSPRAAKFFGLTPADLKDSQSFQHALDTTRDAHGVANFLGNMAGATPLFLGAGALGAAAAGAAGLGETAALGAAAASRVATGALSGGIEVAADSARYNKPEEASAIMQGSILGGIFAAAGEGGAHVFDRLATKAQRGTARWLDEAAKDSKAFKGVAGTETKFRDAYPNISPEAEKAYTKQFDGRNFSMKDAHNFRAARNAGYDPQNRVQAARIAADMRTQADALGNPRPKMGTDITRVPVRSGEFKGIYTPEELEVHLARQRAEASLDEAAGSAGAEPPSPSGPLPSGAPVAEGVPPPVTGGPPPIDPTAPPVPPSAAERLQREAMERMQQAVQAEAAPGTKVPDQDILHRAFTPEEKAIRAADEKVIKRKIREFGKYEKAALENGEAITDPAEAERAIAAGTHERTKKGNVIPKWGDDLRYVKRERATYRYDRGSAQQRAYDGVPEPGDTPVPGAEPQPPLPPAPGLPGAAPYDTQPPFPGAGPGSPGGVPPVEPPSPVGPPAAPPAEGVVPRTPELIPDEPLTGPRSREYQKYQMKQPHIVTKTIVARVLRHFGGMLPGIGDVAGPLAGGAAEAVGIRDVVGRYVTQYAFNHEQAVNQALQKAVAPTMTALKHATRAVFDTEASRVNARSLGETSVSPEHLDETYNTAVKGVSRAAANPAILSQIWEQKYPALARDRAQLSTNAVTVAARGVAHMAPHIPPQTAQGGALDSGAADPPRAIKRQFVDRLMGVVNPMACLAAPTKVNMEAVEATHPELLEAYRSQIRERLLDPAVRARVLASPELRRTLSIAMGAPMTRSETPGYYASLQGGAAAMGAGPQGTTPPGAPGMPKPPGGGTVNLTGSAAKSFVGADALPAQQRQLDNIGG